MARPRASSYTGSTCSEPGCEEPHATHDLCKKHYMERRGEWSAPCSFEDCTKPAHARGLCTAHYRRMLNNGDPAVTRKKGPAVGYQLAPLAVRFWAKVDKRGPNDHWLWTGATYRNPSGGGLYGKLGAGGKNGRTLNAHRVAYELQVGPIPSGFDVDHLCFVSLCQNGAHLEAVAPVENQRRALARDGRTRNTFGRFQKRIV